MYLNAFVVYVKCISNVFIIYLCCIYNVFIIYLCCIYNVFQCISMYLKCLSINLNVFIHIIIGISPFYFHYDNFATCIHLYICFSLFTMTPFLTCFTTTIFSHVLVDPFKLSYILWKYCKPIYTFYTYTSPHISHFVFHVVIGCAKHNRA
jgi:hypothetical protein